MNRNDDTKKPALNSVDSQSSGSVFLSALWCGDRFRFNDELWTVIVTTDVEITARKHGERSIALAEKGYGYIGDSVCSFDVDETVEFIPPNNRMNGACKVCHVQEKD